MRPLFGEMSEMLFSEGNIFCSDGKCFETHLVSPVLKADLFFFPLCRFICYSIGGHSSQCRSVVGEPCVILCLLGFAGKLVICLVWHLLFQALAAIGSESKHERLMFIKE